MVPSSLLFGRRSAVCAINKGVTTHLPLPGPGHELSLLTYSYLRFLPFLFSPVVISSRRRVVVVIVVVEAPPSQSRGCADSRLHDREARRRERHLQRLDDSHRIEVRVLKSEVVQAARGE